MTGCGRLFFFVPRSARSARDALTECQIGPVPAMPPRDLDSNIRFQRTDLAPWRRRSVFHQTPNIYYLCRNNPVGLDELRSLGTIGRSIAHGISPAVSITRQRDHGSPPV